jgi:hypothetical protein
MAHYAFLDENNIVTEVIVGKNEGNFNWEQQYASFRGQACKRTSYNTRGGIYYDPETNEPAIDQSKSFRKNYAGVGYFYDEEKDAFIPPKLFESWILNEQTCLWEPPIPKPEDTSKLYRWDEEQKNWVEVT